MTIIQLFTLSSGEVDAPHLCLTWRTPGQPLLGLPGFLARTEAINDSMLVASQRKYLLGGMYTYPPEKYDFVNWDNDMPN